MKISFTAPQAPLSERGRRWTGAAYLAAALAISPAHAQSTDEILRGVRGVVDLLGQGQGNPADRRAGSGTIHTNPRPQEIIAPTPGVFPSRQALLDATRRGDLLALRQAPEGDKQQFRASLYAIVVNEYQAPPFGHACMNSFNRDVSDLFIGLTNGWRSALSDQPPKFFNSSTPEIEQAKRDIANVRSKWETQRTTCDGNAMGRIVPHPYKAALIDLLGHYNVALQEAVTREATRRHDNFAAASARAQEAEAVQREQAAREQAAQRAAAQQRFDAEAARIRAEEQRRAERERNRIGG